VIRAARPADAEAIAAIHDQGIEERTATFETRPSDATAVSGLIAERALLLVADCRGQVVAFAKARPYEDRSPYYDGISEATIFVERQARRRGIGRALLAALAKAARERGQHKLTAKIFAQNDSSIGLFEACDFRIVGTHRRHGRLDGEWVDVVVVERSL
jgi:L-amino acid N-acyltransferase YncA